MPTLVELTTDFAQLERKLLEADGEVTPELEQMLDLKYGDVKAKVDAYRQFMKYLEARAEYYADRAKEWEGARKTMRSHQDRMKDTMKFCMRQMEVFDLEGNDWRFHLRPIADKITIDKAVLPPEYWAEIIVKEPDLEKIRMDMLLGGAITGVTVEKNYALTNYVNNVGRARAVAEPKPKKLKGAKNDDNGKSAEG